MSLDSTSATVQVAPPKSASTRLPAIVWLLGAIAFIMGTTELIVAGLLPQISTAFDVTPGDAGLLITVFAVGMVIGAPTMALATLRLPRKATLILALLVFAIGHVVAAMTDVFAVILVARFVAAVATGTFWALGAVVATAAAGPGAGARAMGVMVGGVTVANIVGVPLGTLFGQDLGWQAPMWILAGLAVVSAALLWWRLPASSDTSAAPRIGDELALLRNGRLWITYLAVGLMQASFVAVYSYVAPLLTDRAGIAESVVPWVMMAYGVGALAGTTLGGRLGDRHPYRVLIPSIAALALTIGAILVWGEHPVVVVPLFALLGLFGLIGNPILISQAMATVGGAGVLPMALTTAWFNVGIAAGSWLGGVALTAGGVTGPPAVGLVIAVAALFPVVILAVTRGRTR